MATHPKVSAAEKYAEGPRPPCKCGCGLPMRWNASPMYPAGGTWLRPHHPAETRIEVLERRAVLQGILEAEAVRRGSKCQDCGLPYGSVRFEWHHRDAATKEFNVTQGDSVAKVRLLAEIAKCDLLCRGCHRRRHAAQQTHCKQGHEFTPENTYMWRGARHCRICRSYADVKRRLAD